MDILTNKTFLLFFLYLYNKIQFSSKEWDYHYEKTGQGQDRKENGGRSWVACSFTGQLGLPQGPSDPNYKKWTKDGMQCTR